MNENVGLSRRRFLGRAAIVGGALVWAVPVVEVLDHHRAFAASGSGGTLPTTPPPPVSTTVGAVSTTKAPTVGPTSGPGGSDPGLGAGSGSGGLGTRVLGESTTASSSLPFTGSNLPVKAALEAGAGLVAGGVVLRALGARTAGTAGNHTASRPDAPADQG